MKLREFFYFPKSDRSTVLLLLIVGVVSFGLIYVIGERNSVTPNAEDDNIDLGKTSVSSRKNGRQGEGNGYYYVEGQKAERFMFDPNTADSTALLRLGLQPWQVRSIYKYRAKGGVFRKKTDFARLYGLTAKQYRELEPYISISSDYQPAADIYAESSEKHPFHRDSTHYSTKIKQGERIDLNDADTSTLMRIPGIGSYYSRQIVRYRERLGGFVSKNQLAEIDDFPMESAVFMAIDTSAVRKMNINKLTLNQLKRHPYMGYYRAKAICDYRRLKGNISNLNDLRLIRDFTPQAIERLRPYVEF